jgi:hypothetical protein
MLKTYRVVGTVRYLAETKVDKVVLAEDADAAKEQVLDSVILQSDWDCDSLTVREVRADV